MRGRGQNSRQELAPSQVEALLDKSYNYERKKCSGSDFSIGGFISAAKCTSLPSLLISYRPVSALSSFIYSIMTFHQADLFHFGCSRSTMLVNNLIRWFRRQQPVPWGFFLGQFDMEDYICLKDAVSDAS